MWKLVGVITGVGLGAVVGVRAEQAIAALPPQHLLHVFADGLPGILAVVAGLFFLQCGASLDRRGGVREIVSCWRIRRRASPADDSLHELCEVELTHRLEVLAEPTGSAAPNHCVHLAITPRQPAYEWASTSDANQRGFRNGSPHARPRRNGALAPMRSEDLSGVALIENPTPAVSEECNAIENCPPEGGMAVAVREEAHQAQLNGRRNPVKSPLAPAVVNSNGVVEHHSHDVEAAVAEEMETSEMQSNGHVNSITPGLATVATQPRDVLEPCSRDVETTVEPVKEIHASQSNGHASSVSPSLTTASSVASVEVSTRDMHWVLDRLVAFHRRKR